MGSAGEMGELRGSFRVVLDAEWRAKVVVVWVRLGEELGKIFWVVGGLVSVEWKRKKRLGFSVEGGDLDAGCSGFSHSLSDDEKGERGEEVRRFLSSWDGVERGGF